MPRQKGNVEALKYTRASLARKVIRDRRGLGLIQNALAKLAGIRIQTLRRFESGTATLDVRTFNKIDRALQVIEDDRLAVEALAELARSEAAGEKPIPFEEVGREIDAQNAKARQRKRHKSRK